MRANWLGRYLSVEHKYDDEIRKALGFAAQQADKKILATVNDDRIGSKTRRLQFAQARNQIHSSMKGLFGDIGNAIRHFRGEAAGAAADAAIYEEMPLLRKFFKNKKDREGYRTSLIQTANRNVEATITRVIGESKMPLSKRVYRTQALSNGMVDQTINAALARGASAKELANDVRNLIDPSVAGGVSYAAMRLGRTEINNAFHAQSIKDAQDKPWVHQMRWHLSKVHAPDKCLCEVYAQQGTFPIAHVPNKPHPQCRCFVTPELEDYKDFEQKLVGGQYDSYLDDILDKAGAAPIPESMKSDVLPRTPPPPKPKVKTTAERISEARYSDEVADILQAKYPTIEFVGWHAGARNVEMFPPIEPMSAREIGTALDRMLTKYPMGLDSLVKVEVLPNEEMGRAYAFVQPHWDNTTTMALNRDFTEDLDYMREKKVDGENHGWATKGSSLKPWESTITHEYGHVLDIATNEDTHMFLTEVLDSAFKSEDRWLWDTAQKSEKQKGVGWFSYFIEWLQGSAPKHEKFTGNAPSRYAVDDPGPNGYQEYEIIAEAFVDVENNGEKAKATSKAVHKELVYVVENYEGPKPGTLED